MGVPRGSSWIPKLAGWFGMFGMENPMQMDDLEAPSFQETSKWFRAGVDGGAHNTLRIKHVWNIHYI